MNAWHFSQAARMLEAGGVIAYPTEAVWGLGCDPFNELAFDRLLELKRRPLKKGVILIAGDMKQVDPLLANLSADQLSQLEATWPGPVTWLLPDPDNRIPEWIKGDHDSVAVRVSAHLGVQGLCKAFGAPVVSTSANVGGANPSKTLFEVSTYFGNRLDYYLPGNVGKLDKPTQIRDLSSSQIIRS